MPNKRQFVIPLDIGHMHTKFEDSSFIHSRDIIGTSKFKTVHMNLTAPLSGVVRHPYLGLTMIKKKKKFIEM